MVTVSSKPFPREKFTVSLVCCEELLTNQEICLHTESNTQIAYFNILEAGMTIVAVNLPSLWYYMKHSSPEGVLRSVRSKLSIGSHRSSHESGRDSTDSGHQRGGQSVDTNSYRSDFVESAKTLTEAYALTDIVAAPTPQASEDIYVNHSFQRTEEPV